LKPSQTQTQVGRPPNLKENKGRKSLRQNKDYLRTIKKSTKTLWKVLEHATPSLKSCIH